MLQLTACLSASSVIARSHDSTMSGLNVPGPAAGLLCHIQPIIALNQRTCHTT